MPHFDRPILLPEASTFADVLTYVDEWRGGSYEPRVEPGKVGRNEVGPFCTVDLRQIGGEAHRSLAVTPTQAVLDVLAGRLVTEDDHLSFRLIAHASTGKVLVIAEHGYIIGSHWLAYIDAESLPAAPVAAGQP